MSLLSTAAKSDKFLPFPLRPNLKQIAPKTVESKAELGLVLQLFRFEGRCDLSGKVRELERHNRTSQAVFCFLPFRGDDAGGISNDLLKQAGGILHHLPHFV